MSNRKATPDVLGAVLGGATAEAPATGAPTAPAAPAPASSPAAAGSTPQEWEYREVHFRDYRGWRAHTVNGVELGNWRNTPPLIDYLEQAGREGWELVSMGERHHNHKEAYFKRPKL